MVVANRLLLLMGIMVSGCGVVHAEDGWSVRRCLLLIGVTLSVPGLIVVKLHADHDEDERIEKLMEKTHEGKRSPYGQLRQIVEDSGATWPVIERTVMGFEPLSRALLESKNPDIKDSADGYVDAVKEIITAVKRRDAKGVRAGYESLKQSCGECHYKGGMGG
jgi:hypothetical protein